MGISELLRSLAAQAMGRTQSNYERTKEKHEDWILCRSTFQVYVDNGLPKRLPPSKKFKNAKACPAQVQKCKSVPSTT